MRASVVQMNSTSDRDLNLEAAERLVRAAAADGADLVVLPEKWSLLTTGERLIEGSEPIDGPAVSAARSWAEELGLHLQAGSFTESLADQALPSNTALMISPEGEITATYRKIHMFDVEVGGVEYSESSFEQAGDEVTVAAAGEAEVGMTICYDLRFPELFRALLGRGADTYTVPSAFTAVTGRDHWGPLIRARAIENQSFVLAANQVGHADPEFDSWGHSVIADPWGEIIAGLQEGEGFATADLDFESLAETRRRLPAVEHRRPELFREPGETA
ncbi:MAG TPA: carbon-nitrogen hydrolase family protein [Solirubrobacterales bacterium]|nr:carbon-nitrogen hydrolase family protein [Solirubrobacterales bacterium]